MVKGEGRRRILEVRGYREGLEGWGGNKRVKT